MPHLQTVQLTKSYERRGEKFFAINEVDLQIEQNDFVCITGESGSGKSTLLNILAGLLRADSGEILFEGIDLSQLNDSKLAHLRNTKIGFIPQGNSLLYNFSVLENVCLPWYLNRKGKVRKTARELLDKVGIAHLEHESPRHLSGGETRRVAIARSLITNPTILIADEPTSDLDSKHADGVIALFAEAQSLGITIIIVTHERQIPSCANRHFVMNNGLLTEQVI
jgi:putative ABC transport system ATP-binding protein